MTEIIVMGIFSIIVLVILVLWIVTEIQISKYPYWRDML